MEKRNCLVGGVFRVVEGHSTDQYLGNVVEINAEFVESISNDRNICFYGDQIDVVMMVINRGIFVVEKFLVVELLRRWIGFIQCIVFMSSSFVDGGIFFTCRDRGVVYNRVIRDGIKQVVYEVGHIVYTHGSSGECGLLFSRLVGFRFGGVWLFCHDVVSENYATRRGGARWGECMVEISGQRLYVINGRMWIVTVETGRGNAKLVQSTI